MLKNKPSLINFKRGLWVEDVLDEMEANISVFSFLFYDTLNNGTNVCGYLALQNDILKPYTNWNYNKISRHLTFSAPHVCVMNTRTYHNVWHFIWFPFTVPYMVNVL